MANGFYNNRYHHLFIISLWCLNPILHQFKCFSENVQNISAFKLFKNFHRKTTVKTGLSDQHRPVYLSVTSTSTITTEENEC